MERMTTSFRVTSSCSGSREDTEKGSCPRREKVSYEGRLQFRKERIEGTWSTEVFKIILRADRMNAGLVFSKS